MQMDSLAPTNSLSGLRPRRKLRLVSDRQIEILEDVDCSQEAASSSSHSCLTVGCLLDGFGVRLADVLFLVLLIGGVR